MAFLTFAEAKVGVPPRSYCAKEHHMVKGLQNLLKVLRRLNTTKEEKKNQTTVKRSPLAMGLVLPHKEAQNNNFKGIKIAFVKFGIGSGK